MSRTLVPSEQVSVREEDRPSSCNTGRHHCTCMEEVEKVCSIRGYHVFKEMWEAQMGEMLVCEREPHNAQDQYAVAVKKKGLSLGICRGNSRESVQSLFVKKGQ